MILKDALIAAKILAIRAIIPKIQESNALRRSVILNILLLGATFLVLISAAVFLINPIRSTIVIHASVATTGIAFSLLICLFYLSHSGKSSLASKLFVFLYFVLGSFMGLMWGVDTPVSLLFYILAIITASILVGSKFALLMLVSAIILDFSIFFIHQYKLFLVDVSWRATPVLMTDLFMFSGVFVVIFIVSWLYNREINKALKGLKESEESLRQERDSLEIKVAERTEDLKREHLERVNQLSRFVAFGKVSSGLFHDLANHINILLLLMDEKMMAEKEVGRIRASLAEFQEARSDLEQFITSNKRRLRDAGCIHFSPDEEIVDISRLLTKSFSKVSPEISVINNARDILLFGNPTKFSHLITNLITNAIESYDLQESKRVIIETSVLGSTFYIKVRDFGCGMTLDVQNKIFDYFYTTKGNSSGTGLGLSIVKEVIEKDFQGTIEVESVLGVGTTFVITIPLKQDE